MSDMLSMLKKKPSGNTSQYNWIVTNAHQYHSAETMLKSFCSTFRQKKKPIQVATLVRYVTTVRRDYKKDLLKIKWAENWVGTEVDFMIRLILTKAISESLTITEFVARQDMMEYLTTKTSRKPDVIMKFISDNEVNIRNRYNDAVNNTPASGNARPASDKNPFVADDKPQPKQMSITEVEHTDRISTIYRGILEYIIGEIHPDKFNTFELDELVDVVIAGKIPENKVTLEDTIVRDNIHNTFDDIGQREHLLTVLESIIKCKEIDINKMDHRGLSIATFHFE